MKKAIESLLKQSHHKKRETINSNKAKKVLSNKLRSKSGLNVILRQILRNKLRRLQEDARQEKSQVQILLEESDRDESFLDDTVGRSDTFLDKLINVIKNGGAASDSLLDSNHKRKTLTSFKDHSSQDALEQGLEFFQNVGLLSANHPSRNEHVESESIQQTETSDALKFFADVGLLRKHQKHAKDAAQSSAESNKSSEIRKSFVEEEINAAEEETEYLADEIAELLVQLEADLHAEDHMMHKSHDIIQEKLRRFPLQMLLKDRDFIDSVFMRFALMKLPLRTQDIDVSEAFQINKVLQKSMAKASSETRSLLSELRSETFNEKDERERARAIDESRRQLQKLLKIVT